MKEKIKVLQVFASLNAGGAEARAVEVLRYLDKDRFAVDFLSMKTDEGQFHEQEIRSLGAGIIKIPSPRETGALKNLLLLKKIMKQGGYDVVHARTSYHCGMVCLAARLAGVRVRITHACTSSSGHSSLAARLSIALGKVLIRLFSTCRVAVCSDTGEFLFGSQSYIEIPDAVDIEKFIAVSAQEAADLRGELNIPENSTVIGMVGRFAPMKNHGFAVKFFEAFHAAKPDSTLVFVGDGELREATQELVNEKGLADSVIFTGLRRDVCRFMKMFDFLLLPSTFEGFGGAPTEAQAAGLPVVKSSAVSDSVDFGLGLVRSVSLDAPLAQWLSAAEQALCAPAVSDGEIRRAFASRGFSLEAVAEKFAEIYGKAAN